nr:hypothetical protein [Bacilli bacterium]
MIDIHNHIIFDVDDGSRSLEQSIEYLDEIKSVGIEKVVCTPHINVKHKSSPLDKIRNNFNILKEEANKRGIELFLGNEVMYSSNIIDLLNKKEVLTLNNTKYVLVEFKRNENMDEENIYNAFSRIIDAGYKPILAHPELYSHYRKMEFVKKLKNMGVIIQIDSTSLLMTAPIEIYMFVHKLIKNYLVDIVATDSHCSKDRNFKSLYQAYKVVSRKNKGYADTIFHDNQNEIINSKTQ